MGVWTYFFYSSNTQTISEGGNSNIEAVASPRDPQASIVKQTSQPLQQSASLLPSSSSETKISSPFDGLVTPMHLVELAPTRTRRFSFKSLSLSPKPQEQKAALSTLQEQGKRANAAESAAKHVKKERLSKADRRARKGALRVRLMIVGEPTSVSPKVTPVVAKPQLSKLKSQLMEPKTANKLIAQLRLLPAIDVSPLHDTGGNQRIPIHAVCLEHTDAEEDCLHFAKLQTPEDCPRGFTAANITSASFVSAPVEKLTSMLNDMRVVDLLKQPDLGLGQPGDGDGILAGAVPTAETVLNGVKQITPQLMALGYATGRAVLPDHTGIYPPIDRMSVLTYWWGLEVLLPPPTLEYLANAQSITGSVVNFLSALALVNNGVREILPFVRYIAQYIDFEFNSIKRQDKGHGVICAATWIMPAALVPRPWDFPSPPPAEVEEVEAPPLPTKDTIGQT